MNYCETNIKKFVNKEVSVEMKKRSTFPNVSVIILNWNGWEDTIECLESLYNINYPNYDVVIVDNGSDNDSIKKIIEYCEGKIKGFSCFFKFSKDNKPVTIREYEMNETLFLDKDKIYENWSEIDSNRKVTIIKSDKNYGFTGGNNIGIDFATNYLDPNYVLLLNNDTIVDQYFLNILVNFGEANQKIGFLGPKIYFYDFDGKQDVIQYAGGNLSLWIFHAQNRGIFELDHGQYDQSETVDFVHGSCLLAKVDMIKEIGLLDEDFFSYREEADWCLRGHENGWNSLYIPSSKIWHKGGKSSGGNLSPLILFYMTRNDFLFIKKHGNFLQIILFYLFFLFFKLWFFSGVYLVYHRNFKIYRSFLRGAKEGILWKRK